MSTTSEKLTAAIKAMTDTENPSLFDVTIICTTDDHQADYWMKRLSEGICKSNDPSSESKFPMVLAVSEDWAKGGAGNGLGTLYAYEKACKVAKQKFDVDLKDLLEKKEVSAGLFHTAGKGTRLAPLPASENNNKPGVKLPVCHQLSDGSYAPITVLEAVVKQSGVYAPSRKGRLSVFWGDQIFVPSAPFKYIPTHHADIMCTLLGDTCPTEEEWTEKGLDKYGVIAVSSGPGRDAAQVEKVDHPTATKMLKVLGDIGSVGPSLGSFSVSATLLTALCSEFSQELSSKSGKLDTDPHFWMPLTLPLDDYIALMEQKGVGSEESKVHHDRMGKMKKKFEDAGNLKAMGLFGAVDVGNDACWWDYGQLKLYSANNLKFLDTDESSDLLRTFFGVNDKRMYSKIGESCKVDDKSYISACKIKSGDIKNSVMAGVEVVDLTADGAIIVNCTAKKIVAGKNAILYNLIDDSDEGIVALDGDVIVSVTEESGEMMELRSKHSICGGKAWKEKVAGNSMTFEDVMVKNFGSNVTKIESKRKELFKRTSGSFGEF
ncbi:hypothetical protein CTEN210_01920 [Chaetoceros tenuissimus]|uniref:Uncharacterized protein n=1 Tax=Chaetoceros tenuissimus TaxID=426638 RepID=A0AAD3CGL0_9STRA|nr:hypothetical protein CTEN210_01920 [Chaetoceros tenuissimus]